MDAAVPQRRGEFLAGRLCAIHALRQIGCLGPVGRAGRAPLWPSGVVGSISHAGDMAMAVVSTIHSRLGVDCEWILSETTTADIAPLILSPHDRRACPDGWPLPQFLTLVFSAKEAAYKALSRDLTDIPDFHEATITHIGPEQLSLSFRGQTLPIAYALKQGLVVTLMAQ